METSSYRIPKSDVVLTNFESIVTYLIVVEVSTALIPLDLALVIKAHVHVLSRFLEVTFGVIVSRSCFIWIS